MDLRTGMVLNRNTDRRRRLLVDSNSPVGEFATESPTASTGGDGATESIADVRRAYSVGARRRHQRKVIDLIPKRPLAYSAAIAVLATLIVAVNLLAYFSPSWNAVVGSEGVAALALTGSTAVVTWLSTVLLATAAALSLQIYSIRQHRSDDYEGSYQIWGWLALTFAIASLACVVPVGAIASNIFSAITGREFASSWLPFAIGVSFASLVLVRYLLEVRDSYGTVAWAGLAWLAVCFRISSPEMLSAVTPDSVDQASAANFVWGNGLLVAAAATLIANVTYGRFVFLCANGFLVSKPKLTRQTQSIDKPSLMERFAAMREARREAAAVEKENRKAAAEQKKQEAAARKKQRSEAKEQERVAAKERAESQPGETQAAQPKAKSKAKAPTKKQAATTKKAQLKTKRKKTPAPAPEPQPEILKMPSPSEPSASEPTAKTISDSASAKLKQLADAARAKTATTEAGRVEGDQSTSPNKLSKSERRRQRKLQRQQKRAA